MNKSMVDKKISHMFLGTVTLDIGISDLFQLGFKAWFVTL